MIGQVRRLESGRVFLLIRFPPCVFFRGCFLPGERKEILSQGGVVRERRHFRREELAVFVNAPPGVCIGHGAHLLPDSRRYPFVFLLWIQAVQDRIIPLFHADTPEVVATAGGERRIPDIRSVQSRLPREEQPDRFSAHHHYLV